MSSGLNVEVITIIPLHWTFRIFVVHIAVLLHNRPALQESRPQHVCCVRQWDFRHEQQRCCHWKNHQAQLWPCVSLKQCADRWRVFEALKACRVARQCFSKQSLASSVEREMFSRNNEMYKIKYSVIVDIRLFSTVFTTYFKTKQNMLALLSRNKSLTKSFVKYAKCTTWLLMQVFYSVESLLCNKAVSLKTDWSPHQKVLKQ